MPVALSAAPYRVVGIGSAYDVGGSARAINAGHIVAGSIDGAAFTWAGGRLTIYRAPKARDPDDVASSIATAIAADGTAVGSRGTYGPIAMSGLEVATAALFRNGTMTYLDRSRNETFEAFGINDRDTVVGVDAYRGFIRDADGTITSIAPLSTRSEWNGTIASAIDDEGEIVGGTTVNVPWAFDRALPPPQDGYAPARHSVQALPIHAFELTRSAGGQRMLDLGTIPGFLDTFATALNQDGIVVGYSGTSSGPKWTLVEGPSHAWVYERGHMSDLGVLKPGDASYALGVNDAATIVGCSGPPPHVPWLQTGAAASSREVAVRWVDKRIENLNDLIPANTGWKLLCARAIDRDGWIVGDGLYDGSRRAFVLEPRS
ncbi:MAG: hypothetical protein ACYDGM_05080 [Vulcanimicrobiaceae bacterium]